MANNVAPPNKGKSVRAAAAHIDISRARFFVLVAKGVIERKAACGYDLDEVRCSYIRHLRAVASGQGEGMADLAYARTRLVHARTEALERKNAVARGELVRAKAVVLVVTNEFSTIRDRLLGIAKKMSDQLVHQDRASAFAEISRELIKMMSELPNPRDVVKRCR